MKDTGQFVEGIYETPEVRDVVPSHLVRSGTSSAYDVSFGMQVGAAAVELLLAGKSGVTACSVDGGQIQYMDSAKAIHQRYVDLREVALFEALGICFGRKPQRFNPCFKVVTGKVRRIYA
jgi:6-phosphofructokinase 1